MSRIGSPRFAALYLLCAAGALITQPSRSFAQAGQITGPTGVSALGNATAWVPSVQGAGQAEVTTVNPHAGFGGYGAGSLQMSLTGNGSTAVGGGGFPDWAFWYRYAGGTAQQTIDQNLSFGSLDQLSALSFDWFRTGIAGWDAPAGSLATANGQPIPPLDWHYKTPVVRLQLREQRAGLPDAISELIWEGYYNQCRLGPSVECAENVTAVDQWVTQSNMQQDNFWYIHQPGVGQTAAYGLTSGCGDALSFWAGGVAANSTAGLFGADGCLFGASVSVIGIAVGIGSQWPLPYEGFVDNVRLGFSNQNGLALDANFDFVPSTVPEPSTWALMGAGLLALGVVARSRRSRQVKSHSVARDA